MKPLAKPLLAKRYNLAVKGQIIAEQSKLRNFKLIDVLKMVNNIHSRTYSLKCYSLKIHFLVCKKEIFKMSHPCIHNFFDYFTGQNFTIFCIFKI